MGDDERRPKRSRFDQTEPEPRRSRFDRRSRSPSSRQPETVRTRSPEDTSRKSASADPAAAAAAAAAKINAQLQAKKAVQHADAAPARSTASPAPAAGSPSAEPSGKLNADIYVADGDYIRDIEINDLRNRYTLTKGSTQKMIKDETGADVTTRGNYYPDKNMSTAANPPLHLHITSTSKDGLELAVIKIDELMQKELPNLVDERRFRRREQPEPFERDEYGRRKWPEERIPVNLEPIPGFNLRAQVVGQGGAYVKHIQQRTRCKVQIKGRGSGFVEQSTGRESDEPMYLHVAGPNPDDVKSAKELCDDLLVNVREQYQRFKENPPQHNYGGYGHRGDRYNYGGGYGSGYGYSGGYSNNHHRQSTPAAASPSAQATPGASAVSAVGSPAATDYSAQYAQYYGSDPYAAYGGYQNYVAYYQYYQQMLQQQQQQQQQSHSPAPPPPPGGASPPPPPPGSGSPPPSAGGYSAGPPPPPPGSGSPPPPPPGGGYSAVPPPPGL